jgi:hypothetical protein
VWRTQVCLNRFWLSWTSDVPNIDGNSSSGSACFLRSGPSPAAALEFERALAELGREVAREVVEVVYNSLEPDEADGQPAHVRHEAGEYRRLNAKTPNRHVATLFGTITLWRRGYRYGERGVSEPTIFPLEMQLGLVAGATPALACEAVHAMAEAGASQQTVLAMLKARHGVEMGVKRLRAVTEQVAVAMTPHRREQQVQQVIAWLEKARQSSGKHRPALVVGRDGITLANRPHGYFEVATTATLSVYDRKGKRLGTVYLAYAPELGQQTMSDELTALVTDVLQSWSGPPPQLVYVTDAGDHETKYYRQVLRKLRHPQTGKKLAWQWIVDYYHAALRLTTMAESLFGAGREAMAWTRKMQKLLLKPNGPFRVLHSAAALKTRRTMPRAKRAQFATAYRYLRERTKHMQYAQFRGLGLPIGSGVTEAACKTVFTQRLKLSGMRWSSRGAQTILDIRTIHLSSVWDTTYRAAIDSYTQPQTPAPCHPIPRHKAA